MDDDDLVALLDEIHDRLAGHTDGDGLLRKVVAESVAAKGDDDSLGHIDSDP